MTTTVTPVGRVHYTLHFLGVNVGENLSPINRLQMKLQFNTAGMLIHYVDSIPAESFSLSFNPLTGSKDNSRSIILPGSFTILTSRTSPLEPQPVAQASLQEELWGTIYRRAAK